MPTVACTPNGFLVVLSDCSHTADVLNSIITLYQQNSFHNCEVTTPSSTQTTSVSTTLSSTKTSSASSTASTTRTTSATSTATTSVRGKIECALYDGIDYFAVNPNEGNCDQQATFLNSILSTCDEDLTNDHTFLSCDQRAGVNSELLVVNGLVESCTHVSNLINTMLSGFHFPDPAPFTAVCSVDGYLKAVRGEDCLALA